MQDLYNQAISKFVDFITVCLRDNPTINLEVFVHKAEKLQEDDKIGEFACAAYVIYGRTSS